MKSLKFALLVMSINCLFACDAKTPSIATEKLTENTSQVTSQINNQPIKKIPAFLQSAQNFQDFVNDEKINEYSKEPQLEQFFNNIHQYNDEQLTKIFADIGANVAWDYDVINFFQDGMQEYIHKNPHMMCKIAGQLNHQAMQRFATFYFSYGIWNNIFPTEMYQLTSCKNAQEQNKMQDVLRAYHQMYREQSEKQFVYQYIVTDKDGNTNLRQASNAQSNIVATLKNGTLLTPIWQEGHWLFVITDNQAGFVYDRNISPVIPKVKTELYKKWRGVYKYSSYETGDDGVGYGADYTIDIGDKGTCQVDVVGFQVDKHFPCTLKSRNDNLVIYNDKNKEYCTLRKKGNKYYLTLTYYDEPEVLIDSYHKHKESFN